jgi:hypothetical protein
VSGSILLSVPALQNFQLFDPYTIAEAQIIMKIQLIVFCKTNDSLKLKWKQIYDKKFHNDIKINLLIVLRTWNLKRVSFERKFFKQVLYCNHKKYKISYDNKCFLKNLPIKFCIGRYLMLVFFLMYQIQDLSWFSSLLF